MKPPAATTPAVPPRPRVGTAFDDALPPSPRTTPRAPAKIVAFPQKNRGARAQPKAR